MSKIVVVFFSLAVLTASVFSQTSNVKPAGARCSLTEAASPAARGIRLGLTAEQLLGLFPGAAKRREMKGPLDRLKAGAGNEAVYVVFDAATDGDAQHFAGVESVSAGVYKGRVVDFSVQYGGATWRSIDEWVTKLSESFSLPGPKDWKDGSDEAPNKMLNCDRVLIEAAIQGGGASLRIRNADYVKEIQDRGAALEDKKRREVKP